MTYTDWIEIGPAPADEECAQVGDPDYHIRAYEECIRFIELIRKSIGLEPAAAKLDIKVRPHDFGTYYEVIVRYDRYLELAVDYAFRVESEAPTRWE